MARRKTADASADATTCSWKGCENDAESQLALDAGSTTCSECGTEITHRTVFPLCAEHQEEHDAQGGDMTRLLLQAQGVDE
jgi:hypothetical protein